MKGEQDKQTDPAVFFHAETVYQAMFDRAKTQLLDGVTRGLVYEGFLTTLIKDDLHLSSPYYSSVTSVLKRMGCIEQLRRGGSSTPSQWLLHHAPTIELYAKRVGSLKPRPKYVTEEQALQITQRIKDISDRVNRIERILDV
jgi:hypothetical protein